MNLSFSSKYDLLQAPTLVSARILSICSHKARLRLINKRVIIPSESEIKLNPRSRSARLRAAECLITQDDCSGTAEIESVLAEAEARAWKRPALLKKLEMVFLAA